MKVEVNITKKKFFAIFGAIIILAGVFAVYAFNTNWKTSPIPEDARDAQAATFGHSYDEIAGLKEYITDIVNDAIIGGPITCPGAAAYSSTVSGFPGSVAFNMPADCKTDDGCVIRQEIYGAGNKLIAKRYYNYNQDAITNLWQSTYQTTGNYKNGDGDNSFTQIVPKYGDNIRLRDDSSAEKLSDQWSAYDVSSGYGQTIYICTYA